jgi:lipoyl(octanoyl) transferase
MSQHGQSPAELWVCHLGLVPYSDGVTIQEMLRARRIAGAIPDTLLLLEHPPTYTHGRRSGTQDLPFDADFYRAKGIDVHATDRGGKVTYHAPGQLVGYPIMAIHDVVHHVRSMESAIVAALAQVGVDSRGRPEDGPDYTGVWVETRKVASIGVHVQRGVSTHGFAVNVHNDLQPFSWVTACGLPDVVMTSLAAETARTAGSLGAGGSPNPCESLACFRKRMAHAFSVTHRRRQRLVSARRLGIGAANASSPYMSSLPIEELVLA